MIDNERIEEMRFWYNRETNDEETQEWRDELNEEEQALVGEWDDRYATGTAKILSDIANLFFENKTRFTKGDIKHALEKEFISIEGIYNVCELSGEILVEYKNGAVVKLDQDLNLIEICE